MSYKNPLNISSFNKILLSLAAKTAGLVSLLAVALPSSAAMVTFSDFQHVGSDVVDYELTIEDDSEAGVSAGHFRVSYNVSALSPDTVGKLTGLFLDLGDPNDPPTTYNAGNLGFSNESAGDASCGQDFNSDSVMAGMGCNTQLQLGAGAGAYAGHQFDIAIAWKDNDISSGNTRSFEIADLGFTVADFSAVALRGQDTSGSEGSAKEFAVATTAPVPLPGAGWLFLTALTALVIRKQTAR